jgi:DNA-3-methyladenine glycosylase
MLQNRYGSQMRDKKLELNVSNGPAKLCQSMLIDLAYNGIELWSDEIYIEDAEVLDNVMIGVSTRIGIRLGKELPWRYFIKENPWVSRGT